MLVYLGDLGHNLLTRNSDVYPPGVASLATDAVANLKTPQRVRIQLFREPQDLKEAIDRKAPDALGLSNHAWNEELAARCASYTRRRRPHTLLGKLTRSLFARDLRRTFSASPVEEVAQ